jgi:hypothetical protein
MEKYIINNVEYTLDQISSAAKENGVDIDTYINDMGAQVVTDAVEDPVEKPEAVVEETAPATAVTGLQLENGSSEPVNYNQYSQEDIDSLKVRFDQGNFKTNQSEAYLNYKQTGNLDTSLLPEKYSRPINPETNKPFTAMEWVKNSLYNDDVMMEAASDFRSGEGAIDVMSASILRKLYGKENAEKMVAEDARDGETFWTDGMSEEELTKGIKRVEELNNKRKQTASIVEGFKEGDLGQTAAGIFNAATQVYSSLKYAAGTAFTGWFTDFYAQNYINVNKAEAERKGVDFEEYITSGEDNVITPFATAYVQTALESFSAKKIVGRDVINKATKKVTERLVGKEAAEKALKTNSAKQAKETVLGTAKAEASTEIGQSAAEIYSETLAKTDDISEALAASVDFVFSEEGAEVALQGAFGGGIAKLTGKVGKKTLKAMRETRVAIDDNKTEQLVDELSELNKQLIGATDEDVRQGLESQIKEKSAELDGLVTRANGIVDGMTNDEIDEINNMSDLAQAQIQRVNALNAKKKAGNINNDEYLSALEGYKAEFVKAKNRIKGIVEEAADTTPEKIGQRTVKNADAINQVYAKDQSQETFFNTVVPNMDDLVTGIVNRKFRENPEFGEQGITKEDFKNDLIYGTERNQASSLLGLYTSFRPEEGQLLTTYIVNNLENRSKRIVDERLGKQVTVGGVSIDTQESRQLEAEEVDIPVMKGPKFTKRLGLSDEIMNKARKAAIKALSTAGDVDSRTFTTDIVNSINNEIFEDIRALVPKPKEREAFMEKFAGTVWDAMPQSSLAKATRNQTFQEWGMEAPTKEAFIDYFLGRDQEGLKASTINDRVKKQLPQYLAKAVGAEYASDLLQNDAEVRERFALTQKQDTETAAKEIENKPFQAERDAIGEEGIESLKRISQIKDIKGVIKELNIEGDVVINDSNRSSIQEKVLNLAKEGKISPETIGSFANFAFHGRAKDPKTGERINKPARFSLYYNATDPKFREAIELAEENYKGKRVKIGRVSLASLKGGKITKEFKNSKKELEQNNMETLESISQNLADLVASGDIEMNLAATFIYNSYATTTGLIKTAAPFNYVSKEFAYSKKDNKGHLFREEHQPPASVIGANIMWAVQNNQVANIFKPIKGGNYYQTQLSKIDDARLDDSGLAATMPEGYTIFDNPAIRMAQAGINLNDVLNVETEQTMAQEFDAESAETPDAIAASNEVVKEKLEDNIEALIDRAIGKLEDYLGPKGALQANFAAVPINILIGGLRATKLAYRGSRDLTKALEAGYKKVQDYMSQQEWLDFAKQAVTEVKKEPTGATVALAIANEKAIKNEQDRQNKIEVLKKAKVYSKADENKTSKELDEILAEEDAKIRSNNRTEGMERNFRRILRMQTAKGKRPSKWFIPPNAEDIKGLLYAFLPDGKAGVEAKKFFKSAILKPYSDAIAAAEAEILQLSKKFVELKDNAKVKLDENIEGTPYTMGDAIKVYNWNKVGVDVDILKQEYLDKLVGAVEANANAKYLADEVAANYDIEYDKNWRGVPFNKSIYDAINKGTRTKHLQTFSENVDAIFNKDNLQEIENAFGKPFTQALSNSLKRMQTGRNRVSTDAQSNKFLNWINKSVATTMFLNSRSAVLQLLSSLNFIGQKDNNIFQATAAFANQEQWREDYNKLWNSDYLTNRREGAKFDVLADEIAENQESFLNKLLQKGFLPTRYADSFAIALGGAAFYRNRANALMKEGMTKEEAEAQAMKDWQQSAEETQQSSDPSKISEIQASSIGKIIYAFANTPFQYARKSKRLLQDVVSGRSKSEGGMNQVRKDLQSVFYYTVGQAMLFNTLQSALFASLFSDDEEEKLEDKTITAIERSLTSYAKSLGNPGAVVASIYSVLAEAGEQIEKRGRIDNPYKLALEATAISPPLNTKLKDIVAIGNIYKYNHKQIEKDPFQFSIDNPVLEIAGNAASFTGYPLDRVIRKAQNLEAVMNEQTEAWEKLFLTLGWSKWELGIEDTSKNKKKKRFESSFDKKNFDSAFNRLERGVAGKAYNDGSIEVDPNLSPVEREKTLAHEKQHVKDMNAGKLDYDDDFVYWNGGKHKRENGKIEYKGKMVEEGHPSLPWEKRAYDAEPSTKEIKEKKKRTKLY